MTAPVMPRSLYRCLVCQSVMTEADMATAEQCRWCIPGYVRRAVFVENVEWMLSMREHPSRICARMSTTPQAAARRLARAGRLDLARHFHAEIGLEPGGHIETKETADEA